MRHAGAGGRTVVGAGAGHPINQTQLKGIHNGLLSTTN
jgi:hypothetical protein